MNSESAFEQRRLAKDVLVKYHNRHLIKTRNWHCIAIGGTNALRESIWPEWADIPAVIVGYKRGTEVKQRTRMGVFIKLGAAGLDHVPIRFIESDGYKIDFYMNRDHAPSNTPPAVESVSIIEQP